MTYLRIMLPVSHTLQCLVTPKELHDLPSQSCPPFLRPSCPRPHDTCLPLKACALQAPDSVHAHCCYVGWGLERCCMRAGLDARAAAIVMQSVKNVSRNGRTVMVTIHQPSIDIFEAFDALVLLQRGGKARSCLRLLPLPCLSVSMQEVPFICGVRVMKKCRPHLPSFLSVASHRNVNPPGAWEACMWSGNNGQQDPVPFVLEVGLSCREGNENAEPPFASPVRSSSTAGCWARRAAC